MGDTVITRVIEGPDGKQYTDRLELLTTFDAYPKGLRTDYKVGELVLNMGIPLEQRRAAYVFDEMAGIMFTIKVYMPLPDKPEPLLDPWTLIDE
jgi:hypothetical protein